MTGLSGQLRLFPRGVPMSSSHNQDRWADQPASPGDLFIDIGLGAISAGGVCWFMGLVSLSLFQQHDFDQHSQASLSVLSAASGAAIVAATGRRRGGFLAIATIAVLLLVLKVHLQLADVWILLIAILGPFPLVLSVDPFWRRVLTLKASEHVERVNAAYLLGAMKDRRAGPCLLAALRDPSEDVRSTAASALEHYDDPSAIGPLGQAVREGGETAEAAAKTLAHFGADATEELIAALNEGDGAQYAAKALGDLRASDAAEPLAELLDHESDDRRWAAVGALGEIGKPAIKPASAKLRSDHAHAREAAARVFSLQPDPSVLDDLIALLEDEDASVRSAAADALGAIGDSCAGDALARLLRDHQLEVRRAAVGALEQIGWQPTNPRDVACVAVTQRQYAEAAQAGPSAVRPLIEALTATDDYDETNEILRVLSSLIEKQLRRISPEDLRLVAVLDNRNTTRREKIYRSSCDITGHISVWEGEYHYFHETVECAHLRQTAKQELKLRKPKRRSLSVLLEELKDPLAYARELAATELGELKDPQALDSLATALGDASRGVREAATAGLAKFETPRVVPFLVKALDQRMRVRESVTETLVGRWATEAVDPLIATLSSPSGRAVYGATVALGRIASPDAVAPLVQLARDEQFGRCSVKALEAILEERADGVAERDLREVARLTGVRQVALREHQTDYDVDCSRIKELAEHELARRSEGESS